MLLLAIDTATPAVAVAVHDGVRVLAELEREAGRHQAEVLIPAVDAVLRAAGARRADLDGIVCGIGPGPYTGLRVGVVTAATIARVLTVPVHGVGTLDAIAHAAAAAGTVDEPFVAVNDARRREIYWAGYDAAGLPSHPAEVDRPDGLPVPWRGAPAVGPVPAAYLSAFPDRREPVSVRAGALAALAVDRVIPATDASPERTGQVTPRPLYLRRPDATEPVPTPPMLRPMRWWDVADVAAIDAAVFPTTAWSQATFWSELAGVPESRHYLVAVDEAGVILGYAGLAAVPPDADVQTIAVAASARGRGIGALLLQSLLREAARRGTSRVHLEVDADNAAAQALYRRHGFETLSRRRDYYGPGRDALVMRARLLGGDGGSLRSAGERP